MRGPNCEFIKTLTREEYGRRQHRDEYPERQDAPPLTAETSFWFKGREQLVYNRLKR